PDDFTLHLKPGSHYTLKGDSVIPEAFYYGDLNVPVVVYDGIDSSADFNLTITVTGVNNPPVILSHSAITINEDSFGVVRLADLSVSDTDNVYPDDFSLFLKPGDNYTLKGDTVKPEVNFNGDLTVPVVVYDGIDSSENAFSLSISVTPVNDSPVFATLAGDIDTLLTEDLSWTDTVAALDRDGDSMRYRLIAAPAFLLLDSLNGAMSGLPGNADAGLHQVTVGVSDGEFSDTLSFTLTVVNQNDAPGIDTLSPGASPSLSELDSLTFSVGASDIDAG
ncbi:MAG: hypothetical protein GY869_27670, partial [Planctomycetes bacterium]|nr:hypothetical protein [Planctomycetota bacterium]